jgi:hypothetical protein
MTVSPIGNEVVKGSSRRGCKKFDSVIRSAECLRLADAASSLSAPGGRRRQCPKT